MVIHTNYPCDSSNYRKGRTSSVKFLVFHYVGATGSALNNAQYFNTHKKLGASAHYFVDHAPGAEIYRSVPEADSAYHCGLTSGAYKHPTCRNDNSIGIEMCCHLDSSGNWYIDEATMASAAELGRKIMDYYGIPIENVLRHYDVTGKLCPRPLIDETLWAAFKERLVQSDEESEIEEADDMTYYATIDDVPESYKPSVQKLIDAGVLKGYGDSPINVSEDLCRTLTILDRLGSLDV